MTIQWFPGHMTKARRQIEEKLPLIDAVIELLDARAPLASRNPMIDEILRGKPRLVVMNKAELADQQKTEQWQHYFQTQGLPTLPIDSISGFRVKEILPRLRDLLQDKIDAQVRKGIQPRAIRALIVGIPNVGKSTLINKLAQRHVAATGDRPGITKSQQWIRIAGELELLDTPGILWPKFEDVKVGLRLAALGSIKEEILSVEDIGYEVLKFLQSEYPHSLPERYGVHIAMDADTEVDDEQDEDERLRMRTLALMEEIGRKRGCLAGGGQIDYMKTALVVLRDLRAGKLGGITLEVPPV
jgi:ribosome biogenesis GTPase A